MTDLEMEKEQDCYELTLAYRSFVSIFREIEDLYTRDGDLRSWARANTCLRRALNPRDRVMVPYGYDRLVRTIVRVLGTRGTCDSVYTHDIIRAMAQKAEQIAHEINERQQSIYGE